MAEVKPYQDEYMPKEKFDDKFFKSCKLYSFDVYNVLFSRFFAENKVIFLLMQNIIFNDIRFVTLSNFVKENFYDLRIGAEEFVRAQKSVSKTKNDVTLFDIYEVLQNNCNLSYSDTRSLIELEIQVEKTTLVPVKENINLLKYLLKKGKQVILTAKTSLDEKTLKNILSSYDSIFELLPLFVHNEPSFDIEFYKNIKKRYNVPFSLWRHFSGDKADNNKLQKLNIRLKKPEFSNFTDYEKPLTEKFEYDVSTQIYAGISRLCRNFSKQKTNAYEIAVSFAAPILYSYVKWIIDSVNETVETLYFTSKEGKILYDIADIIARRKKYLLKNRYLYTSVETFKLKDTEDSEKLNLLRKYLIQEIDFSEKYAFVGAFGSGRPQDILQGIINTIKKSRFQMFYFQNNEHLTIDRDTIKHAYFQISPEYTEISKLSCLNLQGRTIGYREENGKLFPILEYQNNSKLEKWGYKDFIQGIYDFTNLMLDFEEKNELSLYSFKLLKFYYKMLLNSENKTLAELLGSIPYDMSNFAIEANEIAPKYTLRNLFSINCTSFPFISDARSNGFIKIIHEFFKTKKEKNEEIKFEVKKHI